MSMPKRYLQPPDWPTGADYSGYLKEKVTAEQYLEYQKLRKYLINSIPKLGEIGADELILKLSTHLREADNGN